MTALRADRLSVRKLLGLLVAVAVVLAILGVADVVVRHRVEHTIATRIESDNPGSTATVKISSWPFVGHLVASGTVKALHAHIEGAKVGSFALGSVDLSVQDLTLSRSDLLHGRVVLRSIRVATATAALSQRSLDAGTGLPITLGAGTVGLDGVQVPARISLVDGRLRIAVGPLPAITLPVLPPALLPCAASAVVVPGQLLVSCRTTTVPASLAAAAG